jgi:hypothetical protein
MRGPALSSTRAGSPAVNDLPPRDRQARGTGSGRLAERCLPEDLLRPLGSWGGLAHRPLAPGWETPTMGRKSRGKAAHREARAREAVAGLGASAPVMASMDATTRAPIGPLWLTAPPGAARMAVRVAGVGPLSRSRGNRPSGDCSHLRMLVEQQAAAQRAVEAEIRALLHAGHSWTEIGDALGLSRQGARQRYRHLRRVEDSA